MHSIAARLREQPILRIVFQTPDGALHRATLHSTWSDRTLLRELFGAHKRSSYEAKAAQSVNPRRSTGLGHGPALSELGYRVISVEEVGSHVYELTGTAD